MLSVMEWAKERALEMPTRQNSTLPLMAKWPILRIVLGNAVSVASVLLLTQATMTEILEAKKEQTLGPEMAI